MTATFAADLRHALDAASLAPVVGIAELDPWQLEVLRAPHHKRVLMVTSRQAGKSTVASLMAAHECLFGAPGSTTLILSPSQRQSTELFKKVMVAVRALSGQVRIDGETTQSLTLASGSRVISLPGSESGTLRGYSAVNLLIIDEAARVPVDLYQAVRPMLAVSGGRLVCLSTPGGRRGWLWDEWSGDAPWTRVSVTADMIPRISPAFLAEEEAALGPLFQQEYFGAWLQDDTQFFSSDFVAKLLRKPGAEASPPPPPQGD